MGVLERFISFTQHDGVACQPTASGANSRLVLAISGKIGPAAATWFRSQLDDAKLRSGDTVAFSSPGGDVDQAIIIGEIIRSRGLKAAVATFDAEGRIVRPTAPARASWPMPAARFALACRDRHSAFIDLRPKLWDAKARDATPSPRHSEPRD